MSGRTKCNNNKKKQTHTAEKQYRRIVSTDQNMYGQGGLAIEQTELYSMRNGKVHSARNIQ